MRVNPSLKVEHNSTNNSLSSKNFVMEENLAIFQSIQNSLKEQFASVLIEVHTGLGKGSLKNVINFPLEGMLPLAILS